jgi:hypothetical protein
MVAVCVLHTQTAEYNGSYPVWLQFVSFIRKPQNRHTAVSRGNGKNGEGHYIY